VRWLAARASGADAPRPVSGNACDASDRAVFEAWLVARRPPPTGEVPAECSAPRAARLAAFGWTWNTDALAPFLPEPFASPLAVAAAGGGLPPPAPPGDPELEAAIEALLQPVFAAGAAR
jgi:hypothetical protein